MSDEPSPTAADQKNVALASRQKLEETAEALARAGFVSRWQPCDDDDDAQGYRCRCSFQIIASTEHGFRFAVRENGQPVPIDRSAVANKRIQQAMEQLKTSLNNDNNNNNDDNNPSILADNLTSVTLVTSWHPARDCLVTLHYAAPLADADRWIPAAGAMATAHGWQQLTGRSKGRVLRAVSAGNQREEEEEEDQVVVHDTVFVQRLGDEWRVALEKSSLRVDDDDFLHPITDVVYAKPESAFAHPNPSVMCRALAWMLNRIQHIARTSTATERNTNATISDTPSATVTQQRPTLLELYCGCGAHTMALVKSGLVRGVVAVELDERLIRACRRNAKLNGCQDLVDIVSQDAGLWSEPKTSTTQSVTETLHGRASILLVDPPRQGLDRRVCDMAVHNQHLRDVLYISCGRDALVRDLQILCRDDVFQVVDCVLLDLFPQTYAVESLVHLRRKRGG